MTDFQQIKHTLESAETLPGLPDADSPSMGEAEIEVGDNYGISIQYTINRSEVKSELGVDRYNRTHTELVDAVDSVDVFVLKVFNENSEKIDLNMTRQIELEKILGELIFENVKL